MQNGYHKEEHSFLQGPRSRWRELKYTFGVLAQFLKGFRALHFTGPCITVFGSARFKDDHAYYRTAQQVSAALSRLGFAIMTGGGPGIMEAANRGAREAGGFSIGCNIVLPKELHPNPYLDKYVNIDYFFVRKELLRKYSSAFVVLPGGFGTLDEFFETLTLIQTKKVDNFPVVIMGTAYHQHLQTHIEQMLAAGTISREDLSLMLFTDSVQEVVDHISQYTTSSSRIKKSRRQPIWWLGER